jgi:hypothetical protein
MERSAAQHREDPMKRKLIAVALAATVGLAGALGPSGAAHAEGYLIVETVCDSTPLFTDPALTVPAAYAPHWLDRFYLEGVTGTVVKVEGPLRATPAPTGVYYAKSECWQLVGLHI